MRHARTPTLPELQAFVAAARTGSAREGAEVMGVTPSAVSRALASLEARLGVRLFDRVRQRLVISDAGRAFLAEAGRILDDLDHAALGVMSFGGHRDVLRLACLPTFATGWLIPRLGALTEATIDLSATLKPLDFEQDPRDAVILRAPAPAHLSSLVLAEEWLVAVAAPGLGPGLPHLQQATRPELWLDWMRAGGGDPHAMLRGPRFEQFGMVLAAARAGMGAALVPEILVEADLAEGRLVRLDDRRMQGPHPYRLIWPARTERLAAFAAFRACLGLA